MPYPPTLPPATRVNTDPQFDNHPSDHNLIAAALQAILAELGNDPSGAAADLTQRLVTTTPVGVVSPFAGSTAPATWLLCNGAAVSRTTYATLFAVIGTTYGAGDGTTTFNVPDLRGRVVGGLGGGAYAALNGKGGSRDAVTVPHTHPISATHTHPMPHTHAMPHRHNVPFRDGYEIIGSNFTGSTNAVFTSPPQSGAALVFPGIRATAIWTGRPEGGPDTPTAAALLDNANTGAIVDNGSTQGAAAGSTDNPNGGVSPTDANLPPYIVLNYIIKAA